MGNTKQQKTKKGDVTTETDDEKHHRATETETEETETDMDDDRSNSAQSQYHQRKRNTIRDFGILGQLLLEKLDLMCREIEKMVMQHVSNLIYFILFLF